MLCIAYPVPGEKIPAPAPSAARSGSHAPPNQRVPAPGATVKPPPPPDDQEIPGEHAPEPERSIDFIFIIFRGFCAF